MRGKHRLGAHFYPHSEDLKMRKPENHYRQSILFESGDVDYRKSNKEDDPEIDSKGVQGYPYVFKVIPNLPLTAPIDTMHQLSKGVAKDLLEFLFEISGSPVTIEYATVNLKLPSEFKRSVRSLDNLKHFKANELKMYLLYLAPIVFRPLLNDYSDFRDLNYLVFAFRSLYESGENASLCGLLWEDFVEICISNTQEDNLSRLIFICCGTSLGNVNFLDPCGPLLRQFLNLLIII